MKKKRRIFAAAAWTAISLCAASAADDWVSRAKWIGYDDGKSVVPPEAPSRANKKEERFYLQAVYLRKDFQAGSVAKAILRVTAEGEMVPFLNGKRVATEYFTPGWTEYPTRLYFREYDVTAEVRAGANTLGVILGDGWFRGNLALFGQNHYGKVIRARMELEIEGKDGTKSWVDTDGTWRASTGPILRGDHLSGETYDARLEMPGWCMPGFNAGNWRPVNVGGAAFEPKTIERHPGPPIKIYTEIPAKMLSEPVPGVYIFDLGQNFAGFARLKVDEPAGTAVTLKFGEILNASETVYTDNLMSAYATDVFISQGGPQTWEPLFTYHGFRYVEVRGLTHKPGLTAITGIAIGSELKRTGGFACSDSLINWIYNALIWSQRSNYMEVPTDCPQRDERLGWCGDAQLVCRSALYNFDTRAFLKKWIIDIYDEQSPDGLFQKTAPCICNAGWAPGWADAGIIVPYELWRMTGDISVLRGRYAGMKKFLELSDKAMRKFLGPPRLSDEADWLFMGLCMPFTLVFIAYYAHDLDLMARMAEALGEKVEAGGYRSQFAEVKTAFRDRFVGACNTPDPWTPKWIGADSMTGYALSLSFSLLDSNECVWASERLAQIATGERDQMTGILGTREILPALADTGHREAAYKLLQRRTCPSFGWMADHGGTTLWEHWNGVMEPGRATNWKGKDNENLWDPGMNSFNHESFGSCVQWFYEGILGIAPEEPGFRKVRIRPMPGGGLTFAKGHYDSVRGRIAVEWHHEAGKFTLAVLLPPDTPATVYLPDGSVRAISGKGHFECAFN